MSRAILDTAIDMNRTILYMHFIDCTFLYHAGSPVCTSSQGATTKKN